VWGLNCRSLRDSGGIPMFQLDNTYTNDNMMFINVKVTCSYRETHHETCLINSHGKFMMVRNHGTETAVRRPLLKTLH
jgi:hypothetical protein